MRSNRTYYQVGLYSEFLARMYLRLHGYRILKNRYITGKNTNRAEIDIIAQKKNLSKATRYTVNYVKLHKNVHKKQFIRKILCHQA